MAEWRLGRGWSPSELDARLQSASHRSRNFALEDGLSPEHGWNRHASQAVIAREGTGPPEPGGPFFGAWPLVQQYAFSDPRIVVGHFRRGAPLAGRHMLLEIRVLGLHYLGAVVVSATREESDDRKTVYGFRYDTLEGHIERGYEWFLLTKDHASGEVTFTIRAAWQEGELPNAWSRLGFRLLARRYQRAWHRLAHLRLRRMLGSTDLDPLPPAEHLVQYERAPAILAAQVAATGRPFHEIASEREDAARRERREDVDVVAKSFLLGVVSGSRSMLAPAIVSRAAALSERGEGVAGLLQSQSAQRVLPLLAAGELVADKLPWTPARTGAAPLAGRLGSGALVGAAIAPPGARLAAAAAGAGGAATGTFAGFHLRRYAAARGVPDAVTALCEDALALGLGLAIVSLARARS